MLLFSKALRYLVWRNDWSSHWQWVKALKRDTCKFKLPVPTRNVTMQYLLRVSFVLQPWHIDRRYMRTDNTAGFSPLQRCHLINLWCNAYELHPLCQFGIIVYTRHLCYHTGNSISTWYFLLIKMNRKLMWKGSMWCQVTLDEWCERKALAPIFCSRRPCEGDAWLGRRVLPSQAAKVYLIFM